MRFFCLLLMIPLLSNGQHAIVRGVAPLAIGQEIQLRTYDDPISGKERIMAKQTVEADGSFELKAIPNGVQYVFLQVGHDCADFFIERDKDLELTFVPPTKDPLKPRAFNERSFFAPKIMAGKSKELNDAIVSFNAEMDRFLEQLYPLLKQRKSPNVIAEQLKQFNSRLSSTIPKRQPFVEAYINYSVAAVEQTFLTDRDRLHEKYLKGKTPQWDNPAYVDFVLQFYEGTVHRMAVVDRHEECKKALEGHAAFAALEQLLLETEPKLKESAVATLVLIAGMDGLFGQKDFKDEKLVAALKQFAGFSSNSYHASAARNIAAKHAKLTKGAEAPDFSFVELSGTEKQLSDLQGAYVFLELTDAGNGYCQRETNVIGHLKEEFKNIRFATVCVGNSREEMQSLQKQMNITWEFGGVTLSSPLIEDYDVKSLPLFFIIDPSGKFYSAPAKDPSKGAQSELMALNEMLKAKGKRPVGK